MPIRFIFLRYIDDILRTVEGDYRKVLRAARLIHCILQFTLETPSISQKLEFLNFQNDSNTNGVIDCEGYQISTDTIIKPLIRNSALRYSLSK